MIKLPSFGAKKKPVGQIASELAAGKNGQKTDTDKAMPTLTTVMANGGSSTTVVSKALNTAVQDLIAPESVEVDFDFLKIGPTYYRSMFVAGYPRFVSANWLSPIIDFDSSMDVAMFIYPVESRDILSSLKRKIAEMEATIESDIKRGHVIDPSVQVALDDALAMQEQLAKGAERFFQFGLYLTVNASDLPDLNQISKQVQSTLASLLLNGKRATLQMEDAFKPTEGKLTLAATDGFRLSRFDFFDTSLPKESFESLVIPAKTLSEVLKIITEKEGQKGTKVKIYFLDNNQVLFIVNDVKIYSRLISGNFPDFEKIIPSDYGIRISTSSDELLRSVKVASVFARDSANIVKLKLENSKIKVTANAAEVGENETEFDVEVEKGSGDDFQIAFNYRYILDFLNCLDKNTKITIDLTTPLAPGVFRSVTDKNFLHLVMPVRVQS